MKLSTLTKTLLPLSLAATVAACSSSDGGTNGSGGGAGNINNSSSANILDQTQSQASNTITGLANQLKGTPLQGFVQCLDPTVNQLLDGPDSLLTNLLRGINTGLGTQDPAAAAAALQAGSTDLAKAIQSLTVNLPNALLALAGQKTCTQYTGATTGGTGGSGLPTTGTPLDQLIALINSGGATGTPLDGLIKALQSQAGGTGGGTSTGPTGTPLDAILGPLQGLAGGTGNNAQLLDQLGIGLSQLGTAIGQQTPKDAPVVTPLVQLLSSAVVDLGATLNQLESPQTAKDLQNTLNDLLVNVNNLLTGPQGLLGAPLTAAGQYSQLQPVNQQINASITQGVTALGTSLLQPLAGTGGLTTTLLTALQPLTCPLMLTGNCTATGTGVPSLPL